MSAQQKGALADLLVYWQRDRDQCVEDDSWDDSESDYFAGKVSAYDQCLDELRAVLSEP